MYVDAHMLITLLTYARSIVRVRITGAVVSRICRRGGTVEREGYICAFFGWKAAGILGENCLKPSATGLNHLAWPRANGDEYQFYPAFSYRAGERRRMSSSSA